MHKIVMFLSLIWCVLCAGCTQSPASSSFYNNTSETSSNQIQERKGIMDDRRRYNAWCEAHPGECSTKLRMFD